MDQHGPLVKKIDQDANNYADQMDVECRTRWKNVDDEGETSTLERLKGLGKQSLDQSNVGKRIEYLCNFDMDEGGTVQEQRWCTGEIEAVSDGSWVMYGHFRKTWKDN